MTANDRCLILFSGGQDSTVCLAWAISRFSHVETIGFDYGQRHLVELDCRQQVLQELNSQFPAWAKTLGRDHLLSLPVLNEISKTALTQEAEINFNDTGLPNTFVPGRNLLFFTLAASIAYRSDTRHIVGGMCETDYSGYPDCRDDTLKALQVAINLGMDTRMILHTPLMWIDKAATWKLANQLGGQSFIDLIVEYTHTCYLGNRDTRHAWGYGCGTCPACDLRKTGFERFHNSG